MLQKTYPAFLWPVTALWNMVAVLFCAGGRLLAVILGLFLMIAGIALSLTVIGIAIGIPLAILGFMLMFRGLF